MAGLGQTVKNTWSLTASMNGSVNINGSSHPAWFFDSSGAFMPSNGFMGDRSSIGAHLEVVEGQLVTINFTNRSNMAHTIHLHGLDVDQANDGVPTTSFEVAPMGTNAYQFIAPHAGTYHYHCHVDTVLHYAKGMFGTIIVRPPNGSTNQAWAGGPTFDKEALWQASTVDTFWSDNLLVSGTETARFNPDGFLINGLDTPAAKTDVHTRIDCAAGDTVYLRLSQSSYLWSRYELDGIPFQVVASDGRPYPTPVNATELEIGPGERYDIMFTAPAAGTYTPRISFLDDYTQNVVGFAETKINVS
ncbi:MAG: multicopper oxidase domain-containing protein [Planctomycetes bacterium]|nr:multicopper oxidase domain-containing protein [Planctomycetota bacterium]